MDVKQAVSRRGFVGGVTSLVGLLTLKPGALLSQGVAQAPAPRRTAEEYDLLAKLANNENPYGPPESVLKAMSNAMKYANRYGYPDGGIVEEIAKHHGVKPENIKDLASQNDVDGALVGGASLDVRGFYEIVTRSRPAAV